MKRFQIFKSQFKVGFSIRLGALELDWFKSIDGLWLPRGYYFTAEYNYRKIIMLHLPWRFKE